MLGRLASAVLMKAMHASLGYMCVHISCHQVWHYENTSANPCEVIPSTELRNVRLRINTCELTLSYGQAVSQS
jgi:hypothetical protein